MRRQFAAFLLASLVASAPVAGAAANEPANPLAAVAESLRQTERAFAATVRDRDREAFASYIAEGAVFEGGGALRGREAIVAGWADRFAPETPVLAWEPCVVEIEASGRIGFTRGRYWIDQPGGAEAWQGTFFSVWERRPDGAWKIVLDTGTEASLGPPVEEPCPAPR
jgi:ketosteroid isomerase-like protein